MTTIKGGIKFERGKPLPNKFMKVMGKTVLPFSATGWKSTKSMDLIPESFKKKTVKEKKEIKESKKTSEKAIVKSVTYTKEELENLKWNDLRELGWKHNIKARSRNGFIEEFKEKGLIK